MVFSLKVSGSVGFSHPFEFHIITREEWDGWYGRFVKEHVKIE